MPNERYIIAKFLSSKGWVIHPLSPPTSSESSAGKRPLLPEWQKRKVATEEDLHKWFDNGNNNIGLVCGKNSGVMVVDFDKMDWLGSLFLGEKVKVNTLVSSRKPGRCHMYFQYTDSIKPQKIHEFGIEILGEGSNVVIPPSVHKEGQQYQWIDSEISPIPFPKSGKINIGILKSFCQKMKHCRPCIQHIVTQSNDAMHGNDGRRLMLAVCTELKANNVDIDELLLYSKKVYGNNFDSTRTKNEYKNVDPTKTWKCSTLSDSFPEISKMCASCTTKELDKDYIDVETQKQALDILQVGRPTEYILDTWNKIHVGDRSLGYILMCSAVSSSIISSDGIPINFNGDPGGGKSHACRCMLTLIPNQYWVRRDLSNKAFFYSQTIKPDMILFSDDVILSDDVKTIFKNSVSDFQEAIEHETVDVQRKALVLRAPARITWWLTSVLDPGNNEIERRCLKIVIDADKPRIETISKRLKERKSKSEEKYPEYPEVLVCRAIFNHLKSKKEKIIIPYDITFSPTMGLDSINMFYELLYSTTLINKYQRQHGTNNEIISSVDDFRDVVMNFAKISDTQISKLTKAEISVASWLKSLVKSNSNVDDGWVSSNDIQEHFKKSKGWVSQVINGKNGKNAGSGGLLTKLSNIIEEDVTKKDETEAIRKKRYKFIGEWNELELYQSIAVIESSQKK